MKIFYLCNWKSYFIVTFIFICFNTSAEQIQKTNYTNSLEELQKTSQHLLLGEELILDSLSNGTTIKSVLPPGWCQPLNTGNSAGVIISFEANPNINGIPIQQNDVIGAFFINDDGEMQCAGMVPWPGDLGIVMMVYGNNYNTPEKDGFANGEYMNYKLFSWDYMAEFDVDIIDLDPNHTNHNKWYKLTTPRLTEMTCNEALWVKAIADTDSLCNEALVSFDVEIIEGTGNITYNWSSIPSGFSSELQNPQDTINQSSLMVLEANDGINQFTAFKQILVSHDPIIFAGEDVTTCGVENIPVSGTVNFVSSILWETCGDGTFADPTSAQTDYYLGAEDYQCDSIILSLTGVPFSPCETTTSDQLAVEILPTPVITLPVSYSTCKYQTIQLSAEGSNISGVLWETEGNGTFSDPSSLTTTYTHGSYGSSHSSVMITLTGNGIDPCNFIVVEQTELFVYKNAFCTSGSDATICGDETFFTRGGAANADSIIWSTDGDGTFEDYTLLKGFYTPGENDKINGLVTLTLYVTSNFPCTACKDSDMELTIYDAPELDAGQDIEACGNPEVQLDATVSINSSVEWYTTGDGTFENNQELSTLYTAGVNDLNNGFVELTIQASAPPPCTQGSIDTLIINFEGGATANAGSDMTICSTDAADITGEATNYISILWSTSGDGYFNDANDLQTKYSPGTQDINTGEVILTLTPEGAPPCTSGLGNDMILSIASPVSLSLTNTELEICENDKVSLLAIANNYSNTSWTTSGDGSFNDSHILNPEYTPGITDILNGEVTVNVSVTSISPCNYTRDEDVEVSISRKPEANAGNNGVVCENNEYPVNGMSDYSDETEWTTNGDGSFEDPLSAQTIYHPGNGDILQGGVLLTFKAFAVQPCTLASQDDLLLTIVKNPICGAGINQSICEDGTATLSGSAQNFQNVSWQTSGDGSFSNNNVLNPTYYPGASDKQDGQATLTLKALAKSPCTISSQDDLVLNIQILPSVNPGSDITICETDIVELSGTAENYQSIEWTSPGDGTFEEASALNTIYTPGQQDLIDGGFELCLSATGNDPCSIVNSCFNVQTHKNPIIEAGSPSTSPVLLQYYTNEAEAYFYSTVLWSSNGTGQFSNPNFIRNYYTPSLADLDLGSVILTLTAQATSPCLTARFDSFELTVTAGCEDASAFAGNDATVCVGQFNSVSLSNSEAQNYESLLWETSGDGDFLNNTVLNPVYLSSDTDIQNGSVVLSLTAMAHGICEDATDNITIYFQQAPLADAGNDQTICQGEFVQLSGEAENAGDILWTSQGDGSFDDNLNLETIYVPGDNDIQNGTIELCMEADGIANCGNSTSCINISIISLPLVESGNDQTICQGNTANLSAEAENYSSINWQSNGDGTFNDMGSLNTIYTPGLNDQTLGSVQLCLNASGNWDCSEESDCLNITIAPSPIAHAESALNTCENDTIFLNGSAENHTEIKWFCSGNGIFENAEAFQTYYLPCNQQLNNGQVDLCLIATGIEGCGTDESWLSIQIQSLPEVSIIGQNTVCSNSDIDLQGQIDFSSGYQWYSEGSGSFTHLDNLTTTYIPSPQDIAAGSVEICLEAYGINGCGTHQTCKVITFESETTANAGTDLSICENQSTTITGSAENYSAILWTSEGDGEFTDNTSLSTEYNPGLTDIENGTVELCLKSFGIAVCEEANDCLNLSILKNPLAYAGEDFSMNTPTIFTSDQALASNNSTVYWETSGTGTFNNINSVVTAYTPSAEDYPFGAITLSIFAQPQSPCSFSVSDDLQVIFDFDCFDATANAGADAAVCQKDDYHLNGMATNYNSVIWASSGSGTFNNSTSLDAVYSPSDEDVATGQVDLCLTAFANGECEDASDCMTLTFQQPAVASAGSDNTVLYPETYSMPDAYAENTSLIHWVLSAGTGILYNDDSIHPTYIPTGSDLTFGVQFNLQALSVSPCTAYISESVTLNFVDTCSPANADAGADISFCEGAIDNEVILESAHAENFKSVQWSTAGDGTFNYSNTIKPIYTLGPNDLSSGTTQLSLVAEGWGDCLSASDELIIQTIDAPLANAGDDMTICDAPGIQLFGSASDYSILQWTTNGDGAFIDAEGLNPTYYPGSTDISNGNVEICLLATGISACLPNEDCMTLTIIPNASVDAGENDVICAEDELQLSASANNYSDLLWSTSGDGTFSNIQVLNPIYTPGTTDLTNGSANLKLTAFGLGECAEAEDVLILTIQANPIAFAGIDTTINENYDYVLADASAENESSILWESTGTGNFGNDTLINATYYPSGEDYENQEVTLTLTAFPSEPCTVSHSDQITISFIEVCHDAIANAGEDISTCEQEAIPLSGNAQYQTSVLWTSEGDGTFMDELSLTTNYFPGNQDILDGLVEVHLTAFAKDDCNNATDDLNIVLTNPPTVFAGEDIITCNTVNSISLNGSAQNYTNPQWSTTGTGIIFTQNSLNTIYILSTQDKDLGEIEMILTVSSDECGFISDTMKVTINPATFVYIEQEASICGNEPYTTNGYATNYASVYWSSDGDGTFEDSTQISTVYHPGSADMQNGTVQLCLTAIAFDACENDSECLTLTLIPSAFANAGDDLTICEMQSAQLSGQANNYESVLWESTGDGTFENQNALDAIYSPGENDLINGGTELCLSAFTAGECDDFSDCLQLKIEPAPLANAGSDITICETASALLTGLIENTSAVLWESSGDGIFDNNTSTTTTYYPGDNDITNKMVSIYLTALAEGNCQNATDSMMVNIEYTPEVNAGVDASICDNQSYQLNGSADNFTSVLWESIGDGTFENQNDLDAIYFPGENDKITGNTELCLTAFTEGVCTTNTDCMSLQIEAAPIANAGNDITICETASALLTGLIENTSAVLWESSGDGIFDNNTSTTTTYHPGDNDITNKMVSLYLTAFAEGDCQITTDSMMVNIEYAPEVNAGVDASICDNQSYQLNGSVDNFTTVLWESMGDGTFENQNALDAIYFPGENDKINGNTELCLTAFSDGVCETTYDCVLIQFQKAPIAYAGEDYTVSELELPSTGFAQADYYSELLWLTSGEGAFNDPTALVTTYMPAESDYLNYGVTLTLTAEPINPCSMASSDNVVLTLLYSGCFDASANAGEDDVVCQNSSYQLNGEASNYSLVKWNSSGTGTFDNVYALDAIYFPSDSDLATGSVELCLHAEASGDCDDGFDCTTLNFQMPAVASAGCDNTIPFYESYSMPDAYAQDVSIVNWVVTAGTGVLMNVDSIHPTYFPTISDTAFVVQINFQASGVSPCTTYIADSLMLNVTNNCNNAIADAGDDISICSNNTMIQLNGHASSYQSLSWTTAGDGIFDFSHISSPKYTLGDVDKMSDEVMLYLFADSFGECSSALDSVKISTLVMPEISTGPNHTICEGTILNIDQASVSNYSSIVWSTSGDGTFSEIDNIETQYTPGSLDIEMGEAISLTLSALTIQPCQVTTSETLTLSINNLPELLSELEDVELTVGENATLIIYDHYAQSYQWYGPNGMMPGETSLLLMLDVVDFDDAGYYFCEMTNSCGLTTSNEAKINVYDTQTISIPEGWSGLSSFIKPAGLVLENIFEDHTDELSVLKNYNGIYSPSIGVNTLVNWNTQSGYEVNFTEPVEFSFKGIENTNRIISLHEGWNLIPIISSCPVAIDELFEMHLSEIDIIKEIAGVGVYWPSIGINTIGDFMPGKAYNVRVSSAFDVSFKPCEPSKSAYISGATRPTNNSIWNDIHYTPSTHTIAISQQVINELEPGDIMGAFTSSGVCAGLLEISGNNKVLVLFGDDPLTDNVDGFVENEVITFRIYRAATGELIDFEPEFETNYPNANGVFVNHGMSGLTKASANTISTGNFIHNSINIFPNPSFGRISINGISANSMVEIWNSEGQMLREINYTSNETQGLLEIDLSDCKTGMVYIRIYNQDKVIIKKLILK